jgi:hypothetical protein
MGCGFTTLRSKLLDLGSVDGQLQIISSRKAEDIIK